MGGDPSGFLAKVKIHLEQGDFDTIRELYAGFDSKNIKEEKFHIRLSEAFDEAGLYKEQVQELNYGLLYSKDPVAIHYKLGELHSDFGNLRKAIKNYKAIIEKETMEEEAYKQLGRIYRDNNRYEEAIQVYEKAGELFKKESYKKIIEDLERKSGNMAFDRSEDKEYLKLGRLDDSFLVAYCQIFNGREGVYAKQWISPTGEAGYSKEGKPFTIDVARNHIYGNHTVGLYQLRIDNTVNFIAFDVDICKPVLKNIIDREEKFNAYKKRALSVSKKIIDKLASLEIPCYLEDSGFKGYHVWIFLESPVQAKIAKNFCTSIIPMVNKDDESIGIEIFPKQNYVKEGAVGNLIKLPLGIHLKTGRRSLFLDPGCDDFYSDQIQFLLNVRKVSLDMLQTALVMNNPYTESYKEEDIPFEVVDQDISIPTQTTEIFDPESEIDFQKILAKCPVVNKLYSNSLNYRELSNDMQLVIRHTLGHLKNGAKVVNYILRQCINMNESYIMQTKFTGNPMSCPKIRKKIPEVSSKVDCNCVYDPGSSMYPTPLMHTKEISSSKIINRLQLEKSIRDYFETRKDISTLSKKLEFLEEQFNGYFDELEIEEISTPYAKLVRLKDEGGQVRFSLIF